MIQGQKIKLVLKCERGVYEKLAPTKFVLECDCAPVSRAGTPNTPHGNLSHSEWLLLKLHYPGPQKSFNLKEGETDIMFG